MKIFKIPLVVEGLSGFGWFKVVTRDELIYSGVGTSIWFPDGLASLIDFVMLSFAYAVTSV